LEKELPLQDEAIFDYTMREILRMLVDELFLEKMLNQISDLFYNDEYQYPH